MDPADAVPHVDRAQRIKPEFLLTNAQGVDRAPADACPSTKATCEHLLLPARSAARSDPATPGKPSRQRSAATALVRRGDPHQPAQDRWAVAPAFGLRMQARPRSKSAPAERAANRSTPRAASKKSSRPSRIGEQRTTLPGLKAGPVRLSQTGATMPVALSPMRQRQARLRGLPSARRTGRKGV